MAALIFLGTFIAVLLLFLALWLLFTVDSSQDVTVRGCFFAVNDDCVCLKGTKGPFALEDTLSPPTEHIHVTDCTFHAGQGVVDHLQFLAKLCCLLRFIERGVRPGMIADLESPPVKIGDVVPAEKVLLVAHPLLGNEECRLESQLFEEWIDKLDLRFDGIVEGKHDGLVGNPFGRPAFPNTEDDDEKRSGEQGENFRI